MVVNAVQRVADVVTQRSLVEAFGLPVAEAMWKKAAVVASAVGGIQDQIADGVDGALVDPVDARAWAEAAADLLPAEGARDGNGRTRVRAAGVPARSPPVRGRRRHRSSPGASQGLAGPRRLVDAAPRGG